MLSLSGVEEFAQQAHNHGAAQKHAKIANFHTVEVVFE